MKGGAAFSTWLRDGFRRQNLNEIIDVEAHTYWVPPLHHPIPLNSLRIDDFSRVSHLSHPPHRE